MFKILLNDWWSGVIIYYVISLIWKDVSRSISGEFFFLCGNFVYFNVFIYNNLISYLFCSLGSGFVYLFFCFCYSRFILL